jgi:hypothetical protein
MRKLLLLIGFITTAGFSWAQEFSMDDLMSFSSLSAKKFDNYISKKGFKPAGRSFQNDTIVDTWQQVIRNPDTTLAPVARRISRFQKGKDFSFCLQTSCREEYVVALNRLKNDGFFYGNKIVPGDTSFLFQKASYTVETSAIPEDSLIFYTMVFRDQSMPSAREIIYGDDLMRFTSHEYLATFFGRQNVKSDLYYFSEKEISKCSILFPNSARQAVFIWDDEKNLRGLSQVIISGSFPTASSEGFTRQMRENTWLLNNGLHFDMRLDELVRLNGEDLSFYGRNSSSPFVILPRHKGDIDLSAITVILGCINCEGSSLLDKKIISAYDAVDNALRLHVSMLILHPSSNERQESTASSK